MADDFPDFHHKVCKRLAHLQAGFFQLNIKNDENDLIYQTLIETYEQEMDNVVRSANEIVDKYVNPLSTEKISCGIKIQKTPNILDNS